MDRVAFISIWILVFTIPWANIIFIPELGTISRIIGLPVLVVAAFATIYLQLIRFQTILGLMLLFGVWAGFTYFWSINPEESEVILKVLVRNLIMAWLIFQWVTGVRRVNAIFSAYILGACVSIYSLMIGYVGSEAAGYQRYTAIGFNPNDLAYILAFGIPMAWYIALHESNAILLWLYRLYPALALFAIFLTGSRGGFIVAVVGLSFVVLSFSAMSLKVKSVSLILSIVAISLLAWFVPVDSLIRINTIGTEVATGSLSSRVNIWKAGVSVLGNTQMGGIGVFWGKGVGCFPHSISSILFEASAHNVYLSMIVEVGVIGFLVYLLILLTALLSVIQMPKLERLLWLVLLSEWGIAALNSNLQWSKVTWLIFGLLVAHASALWNQQGLTNTNENTI